MNERLVEYALGSLDPVTRARVEAHLSGDPAARARLDLIEQALAPLGTDSPEIDPPTDLALRTLGRIAEYRCMLPAAPAPLQSQAGPPIRRPFRWADGLVAALLLVLVGGLAVPLLAKQWQSYQRAACANTMRQIYAGLSAYGDGHGGAFPRVEEAGPRGVAGIFAPLLGEAGVLQDVPIACPAARPPEAPRLGVAEIDALYRTSPRTYREVARELAGGYAYSLGYLEGGRLAGLRRDSGDTLPVLADCSGDGGNSANHGGGGQNVLHVGGHVRWCVHPGVGIGGDNIYLDHYRRVRAGVCRDDSVLGAGDSQPYPAE